MRAPLLVVEAADPLYGYHRVHLDGRQIGVLSAPLTTSREYQDDPWSYQAGAIEVRFVEAPELMDPLPTRRRWSTAMGLRRPEQ